MRGRKRKPFIAQHDENGKVLWYGPRCSRCGEVKHIDEFVWHRNSNGYCKSCRNAYYRERRTQLKEEREKIEGGVWVKTEWD